MCTMPVLKPVLRTLPTTRILLLFTWVLVVQHVAAWGFHNRLRTVSSSLRTSFFNYRTRTVSCTSLKASKIPSLIPPPSPPPQPSSLFDTLTYGSKSFVGDIRQTWLNFEHSNVLNLEEQASKVSPELSKGIDYFLSWLREQYSTFGLLSEDFSIPIMSSDIDKLGMIFQGFQSDLSQEIIRLTSKLQPGLDNTFVQLNMNTVSSISPVLTLILSAIISYIIVNTALLSGQTSAQSSPYPMKKYDAYTARAYFDRQPLLVTLRALNIGSLSLQFGFSLLLDRIQKKGDDNEMQRGRELAALLTRLGPTFIKVGQSLSIRTDLLRPAYVRGLETLQDQVPAFDTITAKRILETEWGKPITAVLCEDLSTKPVAAASLGQVYKARLRESNEEVAIKVQRPEIMEQIALDMYLLREIGGLIKRLTKLNTDIIGTVDAWGIGFIDELDYIQEAANGEKFSELILATPLRDVVFAPVVLRELTTQSVLVSSWVNGERLDRSDAKDVSVICSIAMNTYLTMLLEFGLLRTLKIAKYIVFFSIFLTEAPLCESTIDCDPHPGNLLRTPDGKLCIMDWGMVTRLDSELQLTLIEHMAHLTSADYGELPRDLLLLGFVPEDKADVIDDSGVVEVLADIYGAWTAGGGAANINVNDVIAQLQDLTAKKGNLFRIPPYFAYIAKSFSVLEGIGLSNDPKYSIINECLPYVSKRLLTDNDKMGPALSTFIFGPDKSNSDRIINYHRVEQLIEGFGEYTSSAGALVGKENLSKSEILEDVAEQVLNLVFTEKETPLQHIFIEQMAKILSSSGRLLLTQIREQSGLLPSGRTRLGVLLDPLGLWRTSPLVRANEQDERTIETTKKLVDLMQRQLLISGKPLLDLSMLTFEESFELSTVLVKKVWAKRSGVLQTSNRFARELLHLTAENLENGERNTRRLPENVPSLETISKTIPQDVGGFLNTNLINGNSERLIIARQILQDSQIQE